MKFQRDKKKDLYIKSQKGRNGVGFQDIVDAIEEGKLLDVIPNPNQKKYPCQEVLVVEINRYTYIIPFNDLGNDNYQLITAFPNSEVSKIYNLT